MDVLLLMEVFWWMCFLVDCVLLYCFCCLLLLVLSVCGWFKVFLICWLLFGLMLFVFVCWGGLILVFLCWWICLGVLLLRVVSFLVDLFWVGDCGWIICGGFRGELRAFQYCPSFFSKMFLAVGAFSWWVVFVLL